MMHNHSLVTDAGSLITPLILTFNEELNLQRTLDSLTWAKRVLVVDSGSTDRTLQIASSFSNVSISQNSFESFGRQWEFALRQPTVTTDYVLALDADMCVPGPFVDELESVFLRGSFAGGVVPFRLVVGRRALAGGLYPPQLRIFKKQQAVPGQRGHAHSFSVSGSVYRFKNRIVHDDRKPFSRWIQAQLKYAQLELERIEKSPVPLIRDRLRRHGLMPLVMGLLSYCAAGGPLRGRAALQYALERALFECILGLRLVADGVDPHGSHSQQT